MKSTAQIYNMPARPNTTFYLESYVHRLTATMPGRNRVTTVPRPIAKGINREHGEDDPKGTETVAAPATVSGLPFILVTPIKRHATEL